ncbi:tumor necrosis factor receptor superfamily member 23-like isoform X2 [Antechinus flavipes]|uniref:tumor necrosis factor receptor superfamily member 23-like isoform X2 n=1 Tax=Antechinus flavipes TaxID=38775 RepID=UPI002235C6CE|nr:tumor necrosis factor receptor superfamily member 23-like isoform X2 [Antechinus flavipes]
MASSDQEPAGSRGQRPRSAAPRKRRYLSRALTMILVLAWIPAPARAQDMTTSESTLRSTGKDPGPEVTCDPEGEYRHGTLCCLRCPPGTWAIQPCDAQSALGICAECPLGQYAQDNRCWPCTRCREDQEMLFPCYSESDIQCRCKAGHYCEGPECAVCRPCRTSCPEGEELLQGCTDTADIVCGAPITAPG